MSEYDPITGELREALDVDREFMRADGAVVAQTFCVDRGDFERLCDAIDAVHAQLERENAKLRERVAVLDNADENMHDGRRITDELMAWWVRKFPVMDKELHKDFTAIADRIDVEHQKAIRELNNLADGCVLLPLDVDGETIHVGDMMERGTAHGRVIALMLSNYPKKWGGKLHWGVQLEGEQAPTALDLTFHHHHAPTVEDVLREFADLVRKERVELATIGESTIAEYAAKLRLAGDAS